MKQNRKQICNEFASPPNSEDHKQNNTKSSAGDGVQINRFIKLIITNFFANTYEKYTYFIFESIKMKLGVLEVEWGVEFID